MFPAFKNTISAVNKIDTVIGESTIIIGNIKTSGIVKINGTYQGNIWSESDIIIEESAFVKGDIFANNVQINGRVQGNITCRQRLELLSNAKLSGDIEVEKFTSNKGAVFNGKCTITANDGLEELELTEA